jgi:hypothetical protein
MSQPNRCVIENTRRSIIELAEGVTTERLIQALNDRHVSLTGASLILGMTGEVLGRRIETVNTSDYKLPDDQSPIVQFDTLDPYHFNFNEI